MIKDEKDFTMLLKPSCCYIIILLGDFKEYLNVFYVSVFILYFWIYVEYTHVYRMVAWYSSSEQMWRY